MSQEVVENTVCEACGCAGEIGFVIKEGDDVAEVTIYADSKSQLETEFAKYLELAKAVSSSVEYNVSELNEDSKELNAQFKFEVSAEKLIFELKTRSISR
ncbi:YfcZ/YiiS family protein [Vibrio profundi]|uniref:YfcZ/YiiS family protein n=1 Tax=Vibrio profundi TaxID=1774960 RepID=UPI003736FD82